MNALRWRIVAVFLLAGSAWQAQAGVYVGVGVGPRYCHRPYYGGYYYRPYVPLVVGVGVGPVLVGAPAVVQPVTVVQPVVAASPITVAAPVVAAAPAEPAPAVAAAPPPPPVAAPAPVVRASAEDRKEEIDRWLQHLANPDNRARAEACVQLGRYRSQRAVEPLTQILSTDRSAAVREAAARGLGLIGSPAALTALQQAAQGDEDREVRSSARFAVEVLRTRQ